MRSFLRLAALAVLLAATPAEGARIGELADWDFGSQTVRFFSLQDASVRYALAGSMLLGLCCGLMGAFLVVRKLALMGDALPMRSCPGWRWGFCGA